MTDPALVIITVAGSNLYGWTNMKLSRERKDLTGALTFEMFFTNIPANPQMRAIAAGADIQVYIAGNLAFVGTIDARTGSGKGKHKGKAGHAQGLNDRNLSGVDRSGKQPSGAGIHAYADAESYKIVVECRGKTKRLIDSSHDHPTGQMPNTTVPQIFKTLIENFKVQLHDTTNDSLMIERAVFRDGGAVYTELHRWAKEHNHLTFEGKDGKLQLTDDSQGGSGEPLILGLNILSFDATQSDGQGNSSITIKGQRSGMKYHGKEAVMNKIVTMNPSVSDYSPVIHQLNADASSDRLKKRVKYENDRASQHCKEITIDVFSVQTMDGSPWDLNVTHYVEIPPEGIYNEFVVDSLTYFCEAKGTLKTELKLVPVAQGGDGTGGGATSDAAAYGKSQSAAAGLTYTQGQYPSPWVISPILNVLSLGGAPSPTPETPVTTELTLPVTVPLKLPKGYK
jgi:prophage tail gpP-like protein